MGEDGQSTRRRGLCYYLVSVPVRALFYAAIAGLVLWLVLEHGPAASSPLTPPEAAFVSNCDEVQPDAAEQYALQKAEEAFHANWKSREEALFGNAFRTDLVEMDAKGWVLVPTYPCPFERRIGSWKDGGKWTCMVSTAFKPNPVVYSVGSHGDTSFEEAMYAKTHAKIFTFDPTLDEATNEKLKQFTYMEFSPVGLTAESDRENILRTYPNITLQTIDQIMSARGHKYVDVFKIDCEGCEEGVLTQLGQGEGGKPLFGQILVEIHFMHDPKRLLALVYNLERLGYRMFHVEYNVKFASKNAEVSFVHESVVKPRQAPAAEGAAA